MTGPEHYRKAERLLRDEYRTAESIAEAQVHATLALAAATIAAPYVQEGTTTEEWVRVVSGAPTEAGDQA